MREDDREKGGWTLVGHVPSFISSSAAWVENPINPKFALDNVDGLNGIPVTRLCAMRRPIGLFLVVEPANHTLLPTVGDSNKNKTCT